MARKIQFLWEKNLKRVKLIVYWLLGWLDFHLLPKRPINLADASGKKVVLFVGDYTQARIPRMSKWIQRSEEFTSSILIGKGKAYYLKESAYFHRILEFNSIWHVKRIVRDLQGVDVIHAFVIPSYHVPAICKVRPDLPVIVDTQDLWVSYYGKKSPRLYMQVDMKHEAAALAQADGLVSHSMELANACREYGISNRPSTLFFPLFCDEDNMIEVKEEPNPIDIHLVYAGSIAGSFQDDGDFGNIKFHQLIETLSPQGIHLHIYPAPTIRFADLILAEYRELAQKHPNFHLHGSVSQKDLAETLAQYHFGILPFYQEDTRRSMQKFRWSTSQKLFNYIEAGIPVIVAEDLQFQHWMARSFGAAIVLKKAEWGHLGDILKEIDYNSLKQKINRDRYRILLGGHVPDLLRFYTNIIQRKKTQGTL